MRSEMFCRSQISSPIQTKAAVPINISCLPHSEQTASRSRVAHLVSQPRARESPVAHHRAGRYFQYLGGLFNAESAKKPQFDNLALARIDRLQHLERGIKRSHISRLLVRQSSRFLKWNLDQAAAAFGSVSLARVLHQNPPHQPDGNANKVLPSVPSYLWLV